MSRLSTLLAAATLVLVGGCCCYCDPTPGEDYDPWCEREAVDAWCGYYDPMPCQDYNDWPEPNTQLVPSAPGGKWQRLGGIGMAEIHVQRGLYVLPDLRQQMPDELRRTELATQPALAYTQPHYYIAIRLQNLTHHEISADLRDYWDVIHPYQWSIDGKVTRAPQTQPARPLQVTASDRTRVLDALHREGLVTIPPLAFVDYYRDLAAPAPREAPPKGASLRVDLAGRVLVTDGVEVQALVCRPNEAACSTQIPLGAPLASVPLGSLLVRTDGAAVLMPVTKVVLWPSETMLPTGAPSGAPTTLPGVLRPPAAPELP